MIDVRAMRDDPDIDVTEATLGSMERQVPGLAYLLLGRMRGDFYALDGTVIEYDGSAFGFAVASNLSGYGSGISRDEANAWLVRTWRQAILRMRRNQRRIQPILHRAKLRMFVGEKQRLAAGGLGYGR